MGFWYKGIRINLGSGLNFFFLVFNISETMSSVELSPVCCRCSKTFILFSVKGKCTIVLTWLGISSKLKHHSEPSSLLKWNGNGIGGMFFYSFKNISVTSSGVITRVHITNCFAV